MNTAGQILLKARLEKQISLDKVQADTRIRKQFLQALEADDFAELPVYSTARGFLKNYAEYLSLPAKSVLAIFSRDFVRSGKEKPVPTTTVEKLERKGITWNPRLSLIVGTSVFLLLLVGYLGWQYLSVTRPPVLEIISPKENEVVTLASVEVKGRTSQDSLVTIGGLPVFVSTKGEFNYQLDLFPGENKILIEAKNKKDKSTSLERTVFRLDK